MTGDFEYKWPPMTYPNWEPTISYPGTTTTWPLEGTIPAATDLTHLRLQVAALEAEVNRLQALLHLREKPAAGTTKIMQWRVKFVGGYTARVEAPSEDTAKRAGVERLRQAGHTIPDDKHINYATDVTATEA